MPRELAVAEVLSGRFTNRFETQSAQLAGRAQLPNVVWRRVARNSIGSMSIVLGNSRTIHTSRSAVDAIFRTADAFCIFAALYLAGVATGFMPRELFWLVAATGTVLFTVIGEFCGMYRNWRGAALRHELTCSQLAWLFTFLAILVADYVSWLPESIPRGTMLAWFGTTSLLLAIHRFAIRLTQKLLRKHGWNARRYAIVGVTKLAFQLADNIDHSPELGLVLHGFYDDRPSPRTPKLPPHVGSHVGNIDELVAAARENKIDQIYITLPMRAEDRIRGVLRQLADSTATVYLVPDFFVFELLHSRWANIGGLPAVSIFEQPFYGVDGLVKRALDLLLTSAALAVLAVPMLIIALLIKVTSPGPVFFRQRRYGLDGREFYVWKFRSMTVCEDGRHVAQAQRNDARVTPLGHFLRSSSLDEIPQLFNVLGGSMSLVGPRPHASAHNEQYRTMIEGYMLRHKVRPGITGLAQVSGCRGETDTLDKMQQRVTWDHRYIRDWSIGLDLHILLRTVRVVLSRQNAY